MSELHDKARSYLSLRNQTAAPMAAEMANTIAELLAENERLEKDRAHYHGVAAGYAIRAEAAEARLRDLANAEPVGWQHPTFKRLVIADADQATRHHIPLIRRPTL